MTGLRPAYPAAAAAALSAALAAAACLHAARAAAPPAPAVTGPVAAQGAEVPLCKRLPGGDLVLGEMRLHRKERELSFPGAVNQLSGILEVLVATPSGRLHESLLRTTAKPLHLQTMLYLLGLKNGPRLPGPDAEQGDLVDIDIEWTAQGGASVREPIEAWILDQRTGKPAQRRGWVFVGSTVVDGAFQADVAGNLVVTYSVDDTVLDTADSAGDDDTLFVANPAKRDPGLDALVRVIVVPRTGPSK